MPRKQGAATKRELSRRRRVVRIGGSARLCRQPPQITIAAVGDSVNLTHHFLIAMPAMADPHFANSLTYVCEHNPEGALGIVVNKPIDMTLSALFEQIEIPLDDRALREAPVHFGGPGADRPRLRAASAARQLAVDAGDQRRRSASRRRRTCSRPPAAAKARRTCSCRSAMPGGRPGSSSRSSRRTRGSPSRPIPTSLFDLPAEGRLPAAVRLLGIDISRLSDTAGHG